MQKTFLKSKQDGGIENTKDPRLVKNTTGEKAGNKTKNSLIDQNLTRNDDSLYTKYNIVHRLG